MDKCIAAFLDWKGTYAPRACVNYRPWLLHFVKINGMKPLAEYGIPDVVRFRNWLEDRKYASTTISLAMVSLHNFLKFHRAQGAQCLSPDLVRVQRAVTRSHQAITEDELARTIAVIPEHTLIGLRDRLIMMLLWDTGIRVSELCALNVDQISRQERKTVISNKKNANNRIIMWSEQTHALLYAYLPLRALVTHSNALFIGTAPKGVTRLTTRSVERNMRTYLRAAGITRKITPHSLRHGWAHFRRDNFNAPLPFIQKALGHTNPISTFVYEQYSDMEFETQAEKYFSVPAAGKAITKIGTFGRSVISTFFGLKNKPVANYGN